MTRENHSDVQRPDGRRSEARYGPGGSASVRRRQERAAQAASRGSRVRSVEAAKRKSPPQPLFTPSRQRAIMLGLSLTSIAALAGIFLFSPLTYVRQVRLSGVSGLQRSEADRTSAAISVPPKTNLLRLRTAEIVKRLEGLPWIASASVRRGFPDRLEVTVKPKTAVASLKANGQDWEIDSAGIFIRPLRVGTALPPVSCAAPVGVKPGLPADALGVAGALKVISECRPKGGVRIDRIDVDATGELCLNMSDNVAIRLGQEEALPTKIDYVQRIYDDNPAIGSEVVSIDLRWPESPSCVFRSNQKAGREGSAKSSPLPSRRRTRDSGDD